ncbi:gag-pol polyprotein [Cucumis melo var. makuwa]|uniref:Gag-pol polyprotein n=1 Tax=Cucumis melo var. makuwa TaxID=1194695 RepID=A0A5A7TNM4_CUCMM|nr:gag-pol polyprotein [Cucumis melo var. makuwa]
MEIIREGPSASRSPVLDVDWTDVEEQASVGNARALNAIFNGVDLNVFKSINSCSTPKEAWKTLEVTYEGTSKVKISRLQLITSKFEAFRMTEVESVSDYNKRVLEIANESLLLDEKIPDSKIVRKVLRSLPRKFDMKVTVIEEAHDITTLKLDELFCSLLTFEMATADRESKKGKGIAFKSTHVSEEAVSDTEVNMNESIDLMIKQFSNVVKKFKNLNTAGSNTQNLINYKRKYDDIRPSQTTFTYKLWPRHHKDINQLVGATTDAVPSPDVHNRLSRSRSPRMAAPTSLHHDITKARKIPKRALPIIFFREVSPPLSDASNTSIIDSGGKSYGCSENAGAAGTYYDAVPRSLIVSNDNLSTQTDTLLLTFPKQPLWTNVYIQNHAKAFVPLFWSRVQLECFLTWTS